MRRQTNLWRQGRIILVLTAALGAGIGGASGRPQARAGQLAPANLKQLWKLAVEKEQAGSKFPHKGYRYQLEIMKRLLYRTPTNVVEAEFRRICATQVPSFPEHRDDLNQAYDTVLLQALVERSIEQKDRLRLSTLLRRNCPNYLAESPLEFCLDDQWPGSFALLFDCYAESNSAHAKKDILLCLGRAFASLRARFPADGPFLEEARKWYARNGPAATVNYDYPPLPSRPHTPPDLLCRDLFFSAEPAKKLQQHFEQRTARLDPRMKETKSQRLDILQQLLDAPGETSPVWKREFIRLTCQKPPGPNPAFDDLLAQALVLPFLKTDAPERLGFLRELLAANCPEYVAHTPLEFLLATSGSAKGLDPVRLLTAAYRVSRTNTALGRCLHRAFPSLERPGQTDVAFVEACEKWWETNQARCAVNHDYPYLVSLPAYLPGQSADDRWKAGLFFVVDSSTGARLVSPNGRFQVRYTSGGRDRQAQLELVPVAGNTALAGLSLPANPQFPGHQATNLFVLWKADSSAVAVQLSDRARSQIFACVRTKTGQFKWLDLCPVEGMQLGKLGRPRSDFPRAEHMPMKWEDQSADQIVWTILSIRSRFWDKAGRRYTVEESACIRPEGEAVWR